MESTSKNNTKNPDSRQDTTIPPAEDHTQRSLNIPQYNMEKLLNTPEFRHDSEKRSDNFRQNDSLQTCTSQGTSIRFSPREMHTELHRDDPTPPRRDEESNPLEVVTSKETLTEETISPVKTRSTEGEDRFEQKELPKTINNVFGSIEDFLNFFVKRNPEIRDFAKQYKEIEDNEDIQRLNSVVCPQIVESISKEARKDPKSTTEGNPTALFKMTFSSFSQFYGQILRAYTMNTFLYRNLNKYLRHEDWDSFNDLLPYAFGLCKTFFCKHLAKTPQATSMLLYRGAAFDKEVLDIYNTENLKNFSWFSVTSTTTSLKVAKSFMGGEPNPNNPKIPALFMIEVPLTNSTKENKFLSHIDMKPYSEYKMENEVILPPGSVFTLEEVDQHSDSFMTIKLRLISDVGALSHEGLIMPGAMQSKMMTETETKMMCMNGDDLLDALRHVAGNSLIQEIEFCLCKFNLDTLKKMTEILPTMNAINRLKFISCSYDGKDIELKNKLPKINKVEIMELDQSFYKVLFPKNQPWSGLLSFDFAFININKISSQDLKALCTDCLQNLPQLESLRLDFSRWLQFTDQEMADLCALGLKHLTKLGSLCLNFTSCNKLTDQSLSYLCPQGLQPLLYSLTLIFDFCTLLTDHGISLLSTHSLPRLTSFSLSIARNENISDQNLTSQYPLLNNLALDFSHCPLITHTSFESLPKTLTSLKLRLADCSQLTDSSVVSLSKSLLPLDHLSFLDLSFMMCSQLTNQAISQLSPQTLQNLTSFNLDLGGCKLIDDEAIKELTSSGMKSLAKLVSLSLNLESCNITNEGLNALSLNAFSNLPLLRSLSLNLYWCSDIDDEGLITLFTKGLVNLKSLASLNLNFSLLYKISDQGIKTFCSQGLSQLTNLQSLSIDFSRCEMVTDQGLHSLFIEGLKSLKSLKTLSLDLMKCPELTQEGVESFQAQISQYLPQLTSKTINFKVCANIFDQHLLMIGNVGNSVDPELSLSIVCERNEPVVAISAKSQLQNELEESLLKILFENKSPFSHPSDPKFSSISSLNFSFSEYPRASAENILAIASKGIKYLTQLTSLSLDFSRLEALTNQTFSEFCSEGLQPLKHLTSLAFDLGECSSLTDQVMQIISSQPLEYFPKLTSFGLNFGWCEQITDQVVEVLCLQGFHKLPLLKNLNLGFAKCKQITGQGLKILADSIPAQLTGLTLHFEHFKEINNFIFTTLVQKITDLEVLILKFSYSNITNESLKILASAGLANMNKLKELKLNFGRCQEITDEGVSVLCREGLRKLKGLEKLVFDFEGCDSVTDVAVNDFCSLALRNLRMLREVKLEFEYCDNISQFTRMHIKKVLQYFGFKVNNL